MKKFIVELSVVPSALDPLVIYRDNMGVIANAQEPSKLGKLEAVHGGEVFNRIRVHSGFRGFIRSVSWASSKQCTVAKSSTESEYIAASEASSEAVWMKRFIVELGVVPSALDPLAIYRDNMGAIANAQEPRSHKRLKHIKLRYHSIREYIEDGEVKICKVHTDLNVADPLTKAIPRAKHDQHQNAMGVRSTAAPSVPSASGSQIVRTVDVEDDADIEDQSPQDDENELMFPELVDRCSKQAMEDQYMEDIAFGARFDDTDDEEKNENDDSLVLADYEGEDLPTIEWNREDPQLVEGTVFQTMMDCRNAITTYHILTKNNFEVVKSEPDPAFNVGAVDVSLPVPRVRIDAKTIEAIVYNRAAKPPIQPSADPSLMKYTKTAAVPTLVIDATNIEAIADNIASTFDGADDRVRRKLG
ncbi:hypothetical protein QYE76_056492 [Lolium multiflorum]|uniref:Polyprotein n=1 Tax=Lolium multiflorum TaxID=4521 RepID=A0AAD8WPW8_LOLMU|nr:hypothetical protein QYE76_056492 [Lolium multiflorum]